MDRAAPRRRAGKSTRGKRAAGYGEGYREPTPAYVEPGSGEVAAYSEWDDQGWSEADSAGQGWGDDGGWSDQGWYAEQAPPEPEPAPGGGRRIARTQPEEPAPSSYRGKRAARTEPADAYPGDYQTGEHPQQGYPYQEPSGQWQTGQWQSGQWEAGSGTYPAPVPAQPARALGAPPSTPPPAYPAYPAYEDYPEYQEYPEHQEPAPQPSGRRSRLRADESGQMPAYDSGVVPAYDDGYDAYAEPYEPYEPEQTPPQTPRKAFSPRAAALLIQPRNGAGAGRMLGGLSARTIVLVWTAALVLGFLLLGANALGVGPAVVGGLGATVVGTAYTWALTARIGGRPLLFGALAAVSGLVVVVAQQPWLSAGAAVLVAAMAAVYAVMTTVPARRFRRAVRETLIATAIAVGGSFAGLGFQPVVSVERFQYATLACAIGFAFFAVYRLGAGLHGLGRRGAIVVGVAGLMLALTLLYAEMLRQYGSSGLTDAMDSIQRWCLANLRGYPRPIEAFIGVPALAWGVHMRSRRRQGWWVCLFGVALTAPIATTLGDPDVGLVEDGLSLVYSLVVGLLLAFVVIRVDIALSSPPATGGSGRRAAREEDDIAVRPEPSRTKPLL